VTSALDFYRIDTALAIPQILPKDWELKIHGMVDHEMTVTFQDLLDRGLEDAWITLCCVSNPVGGGLISNARWSGVRMADLLAGAGVQDGADAVLSTSADDWTAGTPLTALTDDRDAMLAVAMNGEPLTPEHGFPVRMVVPGLYGYVSGTKWVVDLEVTRYDRFSAFWTDRGWSAKGPIKTESRIDVPGNARLSSGENVIAGVAWAQHTGIDKVELQIGDEMLERLVTLVVLANPEQRGRMHRRQHERRVARLEESAALARDREALAEQSLPSGRAQAHDDLRTHELDFHA